MLTSLARQSADNNDSTSPNNNNSLLVVKRGDDEYFCIKSLQSVSEPVIKLDEMSVSQALTALSLHMQDKCLIYNSGYWTYTLCYNKSISRNHSGSGAASGTAGGSVNVPAVDDSRYQLLGTYSAEKTIEANEKNKLSVLSSSSSSATTMKHFSQFYMNGEFCDINDDRISVEVQYHCSSKKDFDEDDQIIQVREVATCKYLMIVKTSALCSEPAFQIKKATLCTYKCQEIIADEEYEKHLIKTKQSLTTLPKDSERSSEGSSFLGSFPLNFDLFKSPNVKAALKMFLEEAADSAFVRPVVVENNNNENVLDTIKELLGDDDIEGRIEELLAPFFDETTTNESENNQKKNNDNNRKADEKEQDKEKKKAVQ